MNDLDQPKIMSTYSFAFIPFILGNHVQTFIFRDKEGASHYALSIHPLSILTLTPANHHLAKLWQNGGSDSDTFQRFASVVHSSWLPYAHPNRRCEAECTLRCKVPSGENQLCPLRHQMSLTSNRWTTSFALPVLGSTRDVTAWKSVQIVRKSAQTLVVRPDDYSCSLNPHSSIFRFRSSLSQFSVKLRP